MQFIDFDLEVFLRTYWQKQPVLIRNPWETWFNPLDPDELAGLACEGDVEARLITQAADRWIVERGPFSEARFSEFSDQPWTLLVQAVDHHVPDVAALIEPFRFVPNWRIDDVMVSYATDGGGVGPHFDQYDVFLVQGLGRRRWQIGGMCDNAAPLLAHDDLRLLAEFEAHDDWILEPGDILYVPPRFAHNGIAISDDCMTYSIGFRAPARSELIAHWTDHVLADLRDDDRYEDPGLQAQDNPGEISGHAIARLQAMVAEKILDPRAFARWFGQYSSARKYPEIDWSPQESFTVPELRAMISSGVPLCRNPASRFSFIRQDGGGVLFFVDGQCFECTEAAASIAERICGQERLTISLGSMGDSGSPAAIELIATLVNQGSLAFEEHDGSA